MDNRMEARVIDVVRAVISDLNSLPAGQIPVRDLAKTTMLWAKVPLKHLPYVLALVNTMRQAGVFQQETSATVSPRRPLPKATLQERAKGVPTTLKVGVLVETTNMNTDLFAQVIFSVLLLAGFCAAVSWYDRRIYALLVTPTSDGSGWAVWLISRRRLGDTSRQCLETFTTLSLALDWAGEEAKRRGLTRVEAEVEEEDQE